MLNRVQLMGNLGKDPVIKVLPNNNEIVNFSMATSKRWRDKTTNEVKESTVWHNIVVYNQGLVKFVKEYVKKGDTVYIEAELQNRKWTDEGGKTHYVTEIVLNGPECKLQKVNSKDKAQTQNEVIHDNYEEPNDGDIPF